MSKLKIFALGGLGENGKNMFIAEVDGRIFIFDAGLKYPAVDLYGVDAVFPDISYLIEHQDRIEGIFISHGHEDHIGALPYLLRHINIRVYGTHFTIKLIEDLLIEEGMAIEEFRLYRINENKTLKFGDCLVSFYNTTHSIPESVGIALHTDQGIVLYAPDFNFDQNAEIKYRTSFDKLIEFSKKGVLALMAESIGSGTMTRPINDYLLTHVITDVFNRGPNRVIVTAFSSDLDRIQKIINIAVNNNRNIAIIGRKAQRIVDIAMNTEYLKIPKDRLVNLKYIDDKNKNEFENLVVIVTGNRHEPFYVLQRMVNKQDRLIALNDTDHVISMTPPVPGTEKIALRTIDTLYRNNIKVTKVGKGIMRSSHANADDLKMMYNILKPKYIIPVIGEYRHQIKQAKIASEVGYPDDRIVLLENGEAIEFEQGISTTRSRIQNGDILVDGSIIGDINEVVIKDREMLAEEGIFIISCNINAKAKKVLNAPEIVTKGFVYGESKEEIDYYVKKKFDATIQFFLDKKYIEWNELNNVLREEIGREIFRIAKKRPIIIPVIVDAAA